MGSDASNLAASVAKSLDVDRSPGATQRASEIAQDQLAGESVAALTRKKPDAADELRRARIRQEHERRRRQIERRAGGTSASDRDPDSDDSAGVDVMV